MYANDGYRNVPWLVFVRFISILKCWLCALFYMCIVHMCTRVSLYQMHMVFILSMHLERTADSRASVCTNRMRLHLTHANETRTTVVLPVELLKNGHSKYFILWAQAIFRIWIRRANNIGRERESREANSSKMHRVWLAPFTFYSLIFRIMHFMYVITFHNNLDWMYACVCFHKLALTHYSVDLWFTESKTKWNGTGKNTQI